MSRHHPILGWTRGELRYIGTGCDEHNPKGHFYIWKNPKAGCDHIDRMNPGWREFKRYSWELIQDAAAIAAMLLLAGFVTAIGMSIILIAAKVVNE